MSTENGLEQRLRELSVENQSVVSALENGGIENLRQRETSVRRAIDKLDGGFFGELLCWAKLHSERWREIQTILLLNERDLHIDHNASLAAFTEDVKEGLVPLGYFDKKYFDFKRNCFVTLARVDYTRKPIRDEIRFDTTSSPQELVGGILHLENLIPENFLGNLTRYLEEEREKKEIPF